MSRGQDPLAGVVCELQTTSANTCDVRESARFLIRLGGWVLILAAATAMLVWSWNTWPDVVVDFGQQLYIPRQLSQGQVLYRDIATYNGPLSQYWNALWFLILGASLRTLVIANLVLLAALIILLHHMIRRVAGELATVGACLVFVLVFAFGQYSGIGNYNYVCPYAHEMTHGLLLSLAATACVWAYPRRGLPVLLLAGLCLGGAFLTKSEIFQAGAAGAVAALGATIWAGRPGRKQAARMIGVFLAGFLLPPLVSFGLLWGAMPAGMALLGTIGSWRTLAYPQLAGLRFFREGLGVDNVSFNLWQMLWTLGQYLVIPVPVTVLAWALGRAGKWLWAAGLATFAGALAIVWSCQSMVDWVGIARPFPLIVLAVLAVFLVRFVRLRGDPSRATALVAPISLSLLGLCLLAKMVLNARICNYGFVLAMPAAMIVVVAMLEWIPAAIRNFGGCAWIFRAAAMGMLIPVVFVHLKAQNHQREVKTYVVARGPNVLITDRRGEFVNALLEELADRVKPGESLVAFPEGAMLNFLSGIRNPTPYTNFMPPELLVFGQERMLESLRAANPEWVLLVHKDTSEFGHRFFGLDYGRDIAAWIASNYDPVSLTGQPPLQDDSFGMMLLRRKFYRTP